MRGQRSLGRHAARGFFSVIKITDTSIIGIYMETVEDGSDRLSHVRLSTTELLAA